MNLSDVITLGDKIDIKLIRHMDIEENGGTFAKTYQSSVCDLLSDMELEISMPTEGGRMILFQVGEECSFVFFTRSGMYRCIGTVKERYRKGNLYLLSVLVKSELVKFQRREFFRVDYVTRMEYYVIEESIANLDSTTKVLMAIQEEEHEQTALEGMTQDISGGGARFSSKTPLEQDQYILLAVRLKSDRFDQKFYLVSQVIVTQPHPGNPGLYMNRVKFLFKDLKERENIVRFVFEEERRIRRKEVG